MDRNWIGLCFFNKNVIPESTKDLDKGTCLDAGQFGGLHSKGAKITMLMIIIHITLTKSLIFSYLDKPLSQSTVPLTQLKVRPEWWQKTKDIFKKVMGAFYGHWAVKPVNKRVSALAGFLCKCSMMGLKADAVLLLRLIKGEHRACLCWFRNAVSTAGLERKRAGNEKQNGEQIKMPPSTKQQTQAKKNDIMAWHWIGKEHWIAYLFLHIYMFPLHWLLCDYHSQF